MPTFAPAATPFWSEGPMMDLYSTIDDSSSPFKKHVHDFYTPAIFQNPEDYHYHRDGFVHCVIIKEGASFQFYYQQQQHHGQGDTEQRPTSPVTMTAQKKALSTKYSIYDNTFGVKDRKSYLGEVKKATKSRGGGFILLNGSDVLRTPSQVATFLFDPPTVVDPVSKTPSYHLSKSLDRRQMNLPEAVLCRGASCRDLLQIVVDDTVGSSKKKKQTSLGTKFGLADGVHAIPDLVHYTLEEGRNAANRRKVVLRSSTGDNVLCIVFGTKNITMQLQYSAPLNAFQAFGFALAAHSRC